MKALPVEGFLLQLKEVSKRNFYNLSENINLLWILLQNCFIQFIRETAKMPVKIFN